MRNEDFVSVARAVFNRDFPDAACAFVAGSIVTGDATPSSDIDLVVLYNDTTHESYRNSIFSEGWPIEIFVHNLKSQDYFMNNDVQNGSGATLHMIATGIVLGDELLAKSRKEKAQAMTNSGPAPLPQDKIDWERYALTDLLEDLRHPKTPDYIPAILATMLERLGMFYLRAQNKWSGTGKQLIKAMNRHDPTFTKRYLAAFKAAETDIAPLEALMADIFKPYGGFLFENYKSIAPREKWDT